MLVSELLLVLSMFLYMQRVICGAVDSRCELTLVYIWFVVWLFLVNVVAIHSDQVSRVQYSNGISVRTSSTRRAFDFVNEFYLQMGHLGHKISHL